MSTLFAWPSRCARESAWMPLGLGLGLGLALGLGLGLGFDLMYYYTAPNP